LRERLVDWRYMKLSRRDVAFLAIVTTLAISAVAVEDFVATDEFQDVQEGQALPGVRNAVKFILLHSHLNTN